jgi:hypothetical protein
LPCLKSSITSLSLSAAVVSCPPAIINKRKLARNLASSH